MEDDLKLQDFDQWVKIFILKHEGENLSKESKISGHPNKYVICFVLFLIFHRLYQSKPLVISAL